MKIDKLRWRFDVLFSKIRGREVLEWSYIFKELFKKHPSKSVSLQLEDIGEDLLKLHWPNGITIYWPKIYKYEFLNFVYEEVYGHKGCIYEFPGKVDIYPGDVVIDGGACEGFFSLYCLSKGASVISIEPNPVIANVLKRTLEPWIEKGKAIVVERLLGSKAGEMNLIVDSTNVGSSSIVDGWVTGSSVKVPVSTLDQLIKELNLSHVDFVKLDVEGAEREVIKGAKTTIHEFQPKWAVAGYHLPDDYYVLIKL